MSIIDFTQNATIELPAALRRALAEPPDNIQQLIERQQYVASLIAAENVLGELFGYSTTTPVTVGDLPSELAELGNHEKAVAIGNVLTRKGARQGFLAKVGILDVDFYDSDPYALGAFAERALHEQADVVLLVESAGREASNSHSPLHSHMARLLPETCLLSVGDDHVQLLQLPAD